MKCCAKSPPKINAVWNYLKRIICGKHFAELSLELLQTEMEIYDLTWRWSCQSAKKLRADPDDQPPIEERSIMMQIGAGSFPYARICPPYPFKHALKMNSGENELLPASPPPDLVSCRACPIQTIRHISTNAKSETCVFFPKDFIGFSWIFFEGNPDNSW